jgi:hypothetical protein
MEAGAPSVAIHVQSVADMADSEGDDGTQPEGAHGPGADGRTSKGTSAAPTPQRVLSPVGSLDNVVGGNGNGLGGGGPVANDDEEEDDGEDDLHALLGSGRGGPHRRCCRACGRWTPWIWFFSLWLGALLITGGVCFAVEPSAAVVGVTVVAWSVLLISATLAFLGAYALVTVVLVLVEEPLLLVRNWLYFALAVKGPVVLILWSFACLALWLTFPFWCLLGICNADANLSRTGPVTSLVVSLIVTGFAWLLKNLAIKMTAVRFHQGAYFDRLHDALFAEYALQQLLAVLQVATPRRGTVAPTGPATGKGGPRGSLFGRASTVADARSMAHGGGSDPLASGTTAGDARLPWAAGRAGGAPSTPPPQQQQQQQQQQRVVVEHPATTTTYNNNNSNMMPPLNPAELLSLRLNPREDRERHAQAAHPLLARGAPGGAGGGGGLGAMLPHDDGDAESDDDDPAAPLHHPAPTSAGAGTAGGAANTTARGGASAANNLRQRATLNAAAAAQATGLVPPGSSRTSPGPGSAAASARPAETRSLRAWFFGSSSHGHPVGGPEPPLYADGSIRTASPGPGPGPRGNSGDRGNNGEFDGTGSSADLRGSVARVQHAVDFVMRNKLRMVTETGSGGRHVTEIETSRQARALGTSLYRAMRARCEGRNAFTEYDFLTLFPRVQYRHVRRRRSPGMPGPGAGMLGASPTSVAARVAEAAAHTEIVAAQIFRLFDHNADGIVTCADMRETVQAVYRERKVLALTLKDSNTIIDALDRIGTTLVVIILVFVWLAIFGVDALALIVTGACRRTGPPCVGGLGREGLS